MTYITRMLTERATSTSRSGPGYSDYPVIPVLVDGDAVDIVCR